MTTTRPVTSIASPEPLLRFAFDATCAAIGLMVLLPLAAAIALAIKLDDDGAVFYAQPRVGKHFRLFRLLKFRSMVAGADRSGLLTTAGDSRRTRVGSFLRKYKLDELPQLLNVLKGEMQLVGPRPEVERYVQMFRSEYALLLQNRPGVTDPATLAYRHEDEMLRADGAEDQYVSQVLPDKLSLSLDYQRRRSFLSDLRILMQTVLGIHAPCSPPAARVTDPTQSIAVRR